MTNLQTLVEILHALDVLLKLPDFIGKDDVDKHLRWSATNYADRIYTNSITDN